MSRRRTFVSIPEFRIRRAGVVVLLGSLVASHLTWQGWTFAQDSSTWAVEEVTSASHASIVSRFRSIPSIRAPSPLKGHAMA